MFISLVTQAFSGILTDDAASVDVAFVRLPKTLAMSSEDKIAVRLAYSEHRSGGSFKKETREISLFAALLKVAASGGVSALKVYNAFVDDGKARKKDGLLFTALFVQWGEEATGYAAQVYNFGDILNDALTQKTILGVDQNSFSEIAGAHCKEALFYSLPFGGAVKVSDSAAKALDDYFKDRLAFRLSAGWTLDQKSSFKVDEGIFLEAMSGAHEYARKNTKRQFYTARANAHSPSQAEALRVVTKKFADICSKTGTPEAALKKLFTFAGTLRANSDTYFTLLSFMYEFMRDTQTNFNVLPHEFFTYFVILQARHQNPTLTLEGLSGSGVLALMAVGTTTSGALVSTAGNAGITEFLCMINDRGYIARTDQMKTLLSNPQENLSAIQVKLASTMGLQLCLR